MDPTPPRTPFPTPTGTPSSEIFEEGRGGSLPVNRFFRVFNRHPQPQLLLVREGEALIRLSDGRKISLPEGHGCFINRFVGHLIDPSVFSRLVSIRFSPALVGAGTDDAVTALVTGLLEDHGLAVLPLEPAIAWQEDILREIDGLAGYAGAGDLQHDAETSNDDPLHPYRVMVGLSRIWLGLLEHTQPGAPDTPVTPRVSGDGRLAARMDQFLQFISTNFTRHIGLADIAGAAHVGPSECLRCFHTAAGTTPHRYLTDYRLDTAARLLVTTDLPIAQIAQETGLGSSSAFATLFRSRTAVTPLRYRKAAGHRLSGQWTDSPVSRTIIPQSSIPPSPRQG